MKCKTFLLCLTASMIMACSKDDDRTDNQGDFNRTALLLDLSELIDQSYSEYLLDLESLEEQAMLFNASPSTDRLFELREAWRTTLLSWQHIAPYDFGRASDLNLASSNIFPIDVDRINSNIESGGYNLQSAVNLDAAGLQAIDYLIHGIASEEDGIVAEFQSGGNSQGLKTYLSDVISDLLNRTQQVAATWEEGALERNEFTQNDGTDQGSSIGLFLNAFNKSFEKTTRTQKLGIPAGALTFSMTPNPTTVEAYYESTYSVEYLKESVLAFRTIYLGPDDGVGLDDYLVFLDAQVGGTTLDQSIKEQLDEIDDSAELLMNPLSEFVVNEQDIALETFSEMQALVVLWKVDMMSALGVLITYQDNDGD